MTTTVTVHEPKSVPIDSLIDLKTENTDNTDLYLDFASFEFGNAPVRSLVWGEYARKPSCQMDWDRRVLRACRKIESTSDPGDHDFRPRVKDLNSGRFFLVDTGASLSVYPKSWCSEVVALDASKALQAVNGSKIATFGQKENAAMEQSFTKKP